MKRLGKTHHLKHEPKCPVCSHVLSGACAIDDDVAPSPGDATICARCYTFLIFTKEMQLREMTEEEVGALPDDLRIELANARRVCKEIDRLRSVKPSSPSRSSR